MKTKRCIRTKRLSLSGLAMLLAWLLAGCGQSGPGAPEVLTETPVTSITIDGNDRMRFAPDSFTVKAGQTITLVFRNVGSMPKETMGHNLVILESDVPVNAFAAASIGHPRTLYIAPDYKNRVIASTRILGPDEEDTVEFTAPSKPGDYPFVCSFPGHTPAGMKGIMKVVE